MLIEAQYNISLFISNRIWNLIKEDVDDSRFEVIYVFNDDEPLTKILGKLYAFLEATIVDLIFFPSFNPKNIIETFQYIKLLRNHPVCCLIDSYYSWFSKLPPISFDKKKIIKPRRILRWWFCKISFRYFSYYFVSELHIDSNNPLKGFIRQKSDKMIFDLPFKIMMGEYSPEIDHKYPVFVIPGGIDEERRDYISVLNLFLSKDILEKEWKLILLGRPKGDYGKKVISVANQLNNLANENRVIYFDKYIERKTFESFMNSCTHIIAPINSRGYKYGKDSGALYDVFKYNKIGIFDEAYFYSNTLDELKVILTFKSEKELYELLKKIINGEFSYAKIQCSFDIISKVFNKKRYISYIQKQFNKHFAGFG